MAGSLKVCHWDDQPLDSEIAHFADDIIVEGSDAEDSPSTKAERRRRREAIGRRYLQGHIPFIQSASLHGPFGPESGWKNPWKRWQKAELAQPLGKPTRVIHESKRIPAPLEEHESETLHGELQTLGHAEGETSSEPPHGYTGPHDEDNEGDILENTYWAGYTEVHDGVQAGFQAEFTSSSSDSMSPTGDSNDDILNASQEDLERLNQRSDAKGSRVIATASEQARNKRKADTSWLKGMHMLKRSRYEVLEHSSPTPAAGTGRTIIAQAFPPSSPPASFTTPQKHFRTPRAINVDQADIEAWPSSINVIMPSSVTRNLSEMNHIAARDSEAIEGNNVRQIEQPLENGSGLTFVCNETAFDNLGLEDVQGLHKASHLSLLEGNSPAVTPNLHKRQLEIAELSPSDPDGEEISPVIEVRRRSHEKAVPITSTVKAQDLIRHDVNAKDTKTSLSSDTSASEGSFQYRRRNRKSKRKKRSPKPQHVAEVERNVEEFSNQKEKQGFEYAEYGTTNLDDNQNSQKWSKSYNDDNNKRTSKISTESHVTQLEHHRQGDSHASGLDVVAEATDVSPPNPLSEDLMELHELPTSLPGNSNFQVGNVAEKLPISAESTKSHWKRTSAADLNLAERLEGLQHQSAASFDMEAQQHAISWAFRNHSGSFGQPEFSPKHQKSDICMGYGPPPAVFANLDDLPLGETLEIKTVGLLEETDNIRQSPWMDVGLEGLQLVFSVGSSSNGSDNGESHNDAEIRTNNSHTDDIIPDKLSHDVQKKLPTTEFTSTGENRLSNSQSFRKQHRELSNVTTESSELFPSTQVLIETVTANPWNSSMKKSKSHKSIKRVSFGPLPSDDIDNSLPQPALNVTQRLQSPPPPEGALRLTHLDDGFHYQLRATQNLEIAEESLTRFMNTPWEEIPAMKSRAKPPPNSPAVGAMAEAFIAADRENLAKNSDMSDIAKPMRATVKKTKTVVASETWTRTAPQQQETQSHSPLDASFSIAPSGKVTAVNFDIGAFDVEGSLDAMIDDVGSFFEGWDVDSELKKAKETKFEKRGDLQKSSRRVSFGPIESMRTG
jgi:hypothetical protein